MGRPGITNEQIYRVLILYADGVAINEISRITGVRSSQTIYRILDANDVDRRPKKRCPVKMTISFEDDVELDILEHSGNVSTFVCECIRKARRFDEMNK